MIPDVLALTLAQAGKKLSQAGYTYEVRLTHPPKDMPSTTATEYVVRQRLLDNNKVELITVRRIRKEVLENGL